MKFQRDKGFTLIELMIVVAILAILAAVAVGVYKSYIKTSFEIDPVSVLLTASSAMEEYYAEYGKYPYGVDCKIEKLPGFNDTSEDNSFTLHEDKDSRRKFTIKIDCDRTSADSYTLVVENDVSDSSEWKIKWELSCSASSSVGSCKPVQVKGSGVLKKLF